MRLPKSISPCPIKDAIVEMRFETKVPADAVLGLVYGDLAKQFGEPKPLPVLELPPEIRAGQKNLTSAPHYRFSNGKTVVNLGPKVAAVGMVGEYPGWETHSVQITSVLKTIYEKGFITKVTRFGLRYINFFKFDIYPQLSLQISADDRSLIGEDTLFKTTLSSKTCKCGLKIQKGVVLASRPTERGSVIDIDMFKTDLTGDFNSDFNSFLENAHTEEKEHFFSLLRPEFLAKHNPVY
jgi:uncharacterized protein (TIGR04255 family)